MSAKPAGATMRAIAACACLAVVALVILTVPAGAGAAAGSLDRTFSHDGRKLSDLGGKDKAHALAIEDDGRIVVAGQSRHHFAVARYRRSGELDRSFASDGTRVMERWSKGKAGAIAIQKNGKIIVAGDTNTDLTVARFRRNGALDRSFGNRGKVVVPGENLFGHNQA